MSHWIYLVKTLVSQIYPLVKDTLTWQRVPDVLSPKRFLALVFALVLVLSATRVAGATGQNKPGWRDNQTLLSESRFQKPPHWRWGYFTNSDKARIRYGFSPTSCANPNGIIVLVPGFTGCGEEFFESIKDFLKAGYDVWEMDWRGNGGSQRYLANPDKIHSLGVSHDTRDLRQFISTVVQNKGALPIYLIAHSFGGLVALEFLHDEPALVQKAVLSSPAFSFPKVPACLAHSVAQTICHFGHGEDYAYDQGDYPHLEPKLLNPLMHTHDPERLRLPDALFYVHPELRIGGATWGFVAQFTEAVDRLTSAPYLASIKAPVLICSGSQDRISYPEPHARVAAILPAARLLVIKDGRHELMRECDTMRNAWLENVFKFLSPKNSLNPRH
jgi:lysophospholipase